MEAKRPVFRRRETLPESRSWHWSHPARSVLMTGLSSDRLLVRPYQPRHPRRDHRSKSGRRLVVRGMARRVGRVPRGADRAGYAPDYAHTRIADLLPPSLGFD